MGGFPSPVGAQWYSDCRRAGRRRRNRLWERQPKLSAPASRFPLRLLTTNLPRKPAFIRDDLPARSFQTASRSLISLNPRWTQRPCGTVLGESFLTKPEGFWDTGLTEKSSCVGEGPPMRPKARSSAVTLSSETEGETDFVQINEKPVVIAEVLDETGVFFETPVMYQEKLENGTNAQYRLYSIDIFGRRSECCAPIKIRVEKVTPPDAPTTSSLVLSGADAPVLSDDILGKAIGEAIAKNKVGKAVSSFRFSMNLPIRSALRSIARKRSGGTLANRHLLANFRFENPKAEEGGKEGTLPGTVPPELLKSGSWHQRQRDCGLCHCPLRFWKGFCRQASFLKNNEPMAPDMIYFDATSRRSDLQVLGLGLGLLGQRKRLVQVLRHRVPTSEEPVFPTKLRSP